MSGQKQLPPEESFEGQLISGKYRVERLIGSGGMGTVWLGRHEVLGTRVAVKFIRRAFAERPDARRRFEIEARAAAMLKTRHAVDVYDFGLTDSGLPYIVMEYLEGESLSEVLVRRGPMAAHEVSSIITQAARALTKAHQAGIVHRDLKPDNIFLATNVEHDDDAPYVVKLVDFGIAKIVDAEAGGQFGGPTQDGAVIGTPNFMSPEQLTVGGAPNALTDLWSLGACTFAAFTARIPFEGEVLGDIVLKVCMHPMPVPSTYNPKVPAGFDAWFARACNRDPRKRFQSAEELAEELARVCGVSATKARASVVEPSEVVYQLKPADPAMVAELEKLQAPQGMSARTALMAGLVIGITLMIGVLGALAWRAKVAEEELQNLPPPVNATDAAAPKK